MRGGGQAIGSVRTCLKQHASMKVCGNRPRSDLLNSRGILGYFDGGAMTLPTSFASGWCLGSPWKAIPGTSATSVQLVRSALPTDLHDSLNLLDSLDEERSGRELGRHLSLRLLGEPPYMERRIGSPRRPLGRMLPQRSSL